MKLWPLCIIIVLSGNVICPGGKKHKNTVDNLNKRLRSPIETERLSASLSSGMQGSYVDYKVHHMRSRENDDLRWAIDAYQGKLDKDAPARRSLYVRDTHGDFPLAHAIYGGNAHAVETILQEHDNEGLWPFSVKGDGYLFPPLEFAFCVAMHAPSYESNSRLTERIRILSLLYYYGYTSAGQTGTCMKQQFIHKPDSLLSPNYMRKLLSAIEKL